MQFVVSKAKVAGLTLLALGLIALCAFCATLPELLPRILGGAGVVFFGLALVVIVGRFWHRGVAVEIDATGIADHRNGMSVPWSEVKGVWVEEVASARYIALEVDEPERFVTEAGWKGRFADGTRKLNRSTGFAPLNVSFQELTPGIDEAWGYIQGLDLPHLHLGGV